MSHTLNLMTTRCRRKALLARRFRQWIVILVIAGLAALGGEAMLWSKSRELARQRDQRLAQAAPRRERQDDIERLRREIADFQREERTAITLAEEMTPLTPMGLVSRATAPFADRLYLTKVDLRRHGSEIVSARSSPETNEPLYDVTITGVAADNTLIARLGDQLSRVGPFRNLSVSTSTTVVGGRHEASSFTIECVFH